MAADSRGFKQFLYSAARQADSEGVGLSDWLMARERSEQTNGPQMLRKS